MDPIIACGENLAQRLRITDQILDVRSRKEYLGEKPNTALDGMIPELGHVPTAYNTD